MKSLISSLITRRSTAFISTLHGLFLVLIVLGFGPNLEARVTLGPNPQASPHFERQMTPKISRYMRCSVSICANFSINGRSRCSGQFGMCS